jgi:3-dehydroquinate dehydratase II
MNIAIINGPNLNMLGKREPEHYGSSTLDEINNQIKSTFTDIDFNFFQSNSESDLINFIHDLKVDYIVFNPAAFTHTSVALRDAIKSINVPFYEVHLSNVHRREPFRHQSFFSDSAVAVICGLGKQGYFSAIQHIIENS